MWAIYQNGNTTVSFNLTTGTKIRETSDDDFKPAFAENLDIKITNACDRGCPMCYEGSTVGGKHSDIMNQKWLKTLHPFQEVALGGGNVLDFPDLLPLLEKLTSMRVIANITLNQIHFLDHFEFVKKLYKQGLVHGIGVSLVEPTDDLIQKIRQIPTVIIHTIVGITPISHYNALQNKGVKILVLGYKDLGRGQEYRKYKGEKVSLKQEELKQELRYRLKQWKQSFYTISFDNLALQQLAIKELISEEDWERLYQGEEGSQTFYIDAVSQTFSESSIAPLSLRFPIMNHVDQMFAAIQNRHNN